MKVFDLQCAHQHSFEGWFASEDDYGQQLARGLLTCPMCGDMTVRKMLSAPRLNLKSSRAASPDRTPSSDDHQEASSDQRLEHSPPVEAVPSRELQARVMRAMREVMAKTEDVGEHFADQARAMHHGELEQRGIRGQTSPDVAMALIEEGIEVMPLPLIPAVKETLQYPAASRSARGARAGIGRPHSTPFAEMT